MIGSVTKMFTSTAIMQLVENNTLDLDADINTYIPFSVRHPNYPSTPITIRMLLTHRSGISRSISNKTLWDFDAEMLTWANNNLGANITIWDARPTLGAFINGSLNPSGQYYVSDYWASRPGTQWEYSSTGFLLLTYIVEQVVDQPFAEYLHGHILAPLDMASTGYNHTAFTGRNAIPYERRDNANLAHPIYNHYDIGGGALRSTVQDLGHFLIAHMNQGRYHNTPILRPETVDMMQTSQFSMSGHDFGNFTFVGHGLGWPLYEDDIIGHSQYGIVFLLNRGTSLVQDDYLVNTFFPTVINILFDEALSRATS
jgi:CubicO group peptidase (beta-lactamase class C family)